MPKWTGLPLAVSLALVSMPIPVASALSHRCEPALIDVYKRGPAAAARARQTIAQLEAGEIVRIWRSAGVPISAIAEMACVERKTVYSWLDDVPAREQNLRRLEDLRQALTGELDELRAIFRVWDRELSDGTTLRELLRAPTISRTKVQNAIRELEPAISKHVRLDRRSTHGENPVTSELPEVGIARS